MNLLTIVLLAAVAVQGNGVDLSGNWKLDRDASTDVAPVREMTNLVISQSPDGIRFDYMDGAKVLATRTLEPDWIYRRSFSTRTVAGYTRARWNHNQLVVQNRGVLDLDGTQFYEDGERWSISTDGKTLTETASDGTHLVFDRIEDVHQPEH
jgi:hypothetical protein